MGTHSIVSRLGDAARAAHSAWNQALADRADHELDCEICELFSSQKCPTDERLATLDTALHAEWVKARAAEVSL